MVQVQGRVNKDKVCAYIYRYQWPCKGVFSKHKYWYGCITRSLHNIVTYIPTTESHISEDCGLLKCDTLYIGNNVFDWFINCLPVFFMLSNQQYSSLHILYQSGQYSASRSAQISLCLTKWLSCSMNVNVKNVAIIEMFLTESLHTTHNYKFPHNTIWEMLC
jgi:hypothetical protein